MCANVSPEKARKIRYLQMKNDPRMWMRYHWNHPNRPDDNYDFRTDDGEPLHYLADNRSHLNPDCWGNINVLLMARGCLKTTSSIGIANWMLDMYPNTEMFMTAPTKDHVDEFMDKFMENAVDTPLEDKRVRDRRKHQKFKTKVVNPDGETRYDHSSLKAKSAWDADKGLRGPHSQAGLIDEFQDVDEQAFGVFLEIIDQGVPGVDYFPSVFIIGTPKLKNSFFHRLWKKSNQRTWDAEADVAEYAENPDAYDRDKGWWIDQSEPGTYAPPHTCGVCGTEMRDTPDNCPECGTELDLEQLDSFTIKGWHIDQFNSPLHDEGTIEYKRQDLPEKQFENEVLANFYSPEDDLLNDEHIRDSIDNERGFRSSRMYEDSTVVVSVDWGGGKSENASDTTITVGEKVEYTDDEEDNWDIFIHDINFVDRDYGKNQERELVEEYITKFDADYVVVDEGHAGARREELREDYPEIVTGVGYGNVSPSEEVKWKTDGDDIEKFVTIDKTYQIEKFVDTFKDGKFVIPGEDLHFGVRGANGTKLINHLTAPYKEHTETPSGRKKLKVLSDRNDDAFDTFVYQYLGHEVLSKGPSLTEFALNKRDYS